MARLILFLFLLALSSCSSQEKAIIGYWEMEKLEYQNDSSSHEPSSSHKWVEFHKNHTLDHGSYANQISNSGTWQYDKKKKLIIIVYNNSMNAKGDEIVWKIEKLNKNEFFVGGKYPYIHFNKVVK